MKKLFFISFLAAIVLTISCEKDQTNEFESIDNETLILKSTLAEDADEVSEYEVDFFTSTKSEMNKFGREWRGRQLGKHSPMGGRYRFGQCPDITVDSADTGYPRTITLNYGEGTELANGKIISGKIIINVSAPPLTDGAVKEVTYENFSVNETQISGTKVITFTGDNLTTKVFTSNGEMLYTFSDGSTMTKTNEKVRTWVSGIDTELDPVDDIIHITGSSSKIRSDGKEMQKEINEALVKTGSCKFIVQGVVTFTKNGEASAKLDYGDGTCDDKAILTIGGEEKEITLGKRIGKGKRNGKG